MKTLLLALGLYHGALLGLYLLSPLLPRSLYWLRRCNMVFAAWYDAWLGVYYDRSASALYVFLLPFIGLRISCHSRASLGRLAQNLLRELAQMEGIRATPPGDFRDRLLEEVWAILPMGRAAAALTEEALERLAGGAGAIACERQRQLRAEGYTPERDALHNHAEMVRAAKCYLLVADARVNRVPLPPCFFPKAWPWDHATWKPADRAKRNLEKAGALIAAEWDRLDRLEASQTKTTKDAL